MFPLPLLPRSLYKQISSITGLLTDYIVFPGRRAILNFLQLTSDSESCYSNVVLFSGATSAGGRGQRGQLTPPPKCLEGPAPTLLLFL